MERLKYRIGHWTGKQWLAPLIVSLVAACYICAEVQSRLGSSSGTRYLVAKRDLLAGQPIHFLDLATKLDEKVHPTRLTDQDVHLLKGAVVLEPVGAGKPLLYSMVRFSPAVWGIGRSVPRGYRAYGLQIESSLPLSGGDRVDLLLRPHKPGASTEIVTQKTLVLEHVGGRTVLALTPGEVETVEGALKKGSLAVVLRNPYDKKKMKKKPRPGGKSVPVITESS